MPLDFLLDSTQDDLAISAGDFVIGEATQQHVACWLMAQKGEIRQWPLLGVGLRSWVLDESSQIELKHVVEVNAAYDECRIEQIQVQETQDGYQPIINAYY